MTPTEPPPFGTPVHGTPPHVPPPVRENNTADVVLSWILYAMQVVGSVVGAAISLFSIFLTDSCGSSSTDASVCDTDYFGSVLVGYWIALLVLAVVVPIGLIVAAARRTPSWPWAVGGAALAVFSTFVFFALVTR